MTNAMTVMTSTAEDIEKENSTITFRHIRYCTGRWGPHAADTIQVGLMDQAVLLPAVTRTPVLAVAFTEKDFFAQMLSFPFTSKSGFGFAHSMDGFTGSNPMPDSDSAIYRPTLQLRARDSRIA